MGDYSEAIARVTAAKVGGFIKMVLQEMSEQPEHVSVMGADLSKPEKPESPTAFRRFGFSVPVDRGTFK